MPQFYFHLETAAGRDTDAIGLICDSVEAAYLEAHRAMTDIGADAMRQGESVADHRFEVCDEAQRLVLELPFTELLGERVRPARVSSDTLRSRLAANVQRTYGLQREVNEALTRVRETLATTLELLKRL